MSSAEIEYDKHDIRDREDLMSLLHAFYQRVLDDPIIGFYFTDVVAFSLDEHLPRVGDFWSSQLFGSLDYQGRNFEVHLALHRHTALTEDHFHRWLYLLHLTIDQHFKGERADAMKRRAQAIARSMAQALARRDLPPSEGEGVYEPT